MTTWLCLSLDDPLEEFFLCGFFGLSPVLVLGFSFVPFSLFLFFEKKYEEPKVKIILEI